MTVHSLARWQAIINRYQVVFLGLIVFMAAVLRFYKLDAWSFWLDEILTINASEFIADWPLTRLPVYLVATRVITDFLGVNEWSARLFSVIIGIVTPLIMYFPVKRLFGGNVALIAMFILALSPWHIFWSQHARFYTLWLLFYCLGLLLFYIALEEHRPKLLVIAVILLILAVRERIMALFFVPALGLYLFALLGLRFGNAFRLKRPALLAVFVGVGLILAYDVGGYLFAGRGSAIVSVMEAFIGQQNTNPLRLGASIIYRISLPVIAFGAMGGLLLLWERQRSGLFLVINAFIPPLILLVLSLVMFTVDRYIFMALPFWAILTAIALHRLIEGSRNPLFAAGIMVFLFVFLLSEDVLYYQYQHGGRADWRQAFALVEQQQESDDIILSNWPQIGEYYLGGETLLPLAIPPPAHSGRAWYVVDDIEAYVDSEQQAWLRENAILVDIIRNSMPGKNMDIHVYRTTLTN